MPSLKRLDAYYSLEGTVFRKYKQRETVAGDGAPIIPGHIYQTYLQYKSLRNVARCRIIQR